MNECVICGKQTENEKICEDCKLEAEEENLVYYEFYVSTCPAGDIIEYVALDKNMSDNEIENEFDGWLRNVVDSGYEKQ